MQQQSFLAILLLFLFTFDGVSASFKKRRSEFADTDFEMSGYDSVVSSEAYGTGYEAGYETEEGRQVEDEADENGDVIRSLLGKRSKEQKTDQTSHIKVVGILKGTTLRPRRSVTFDQKIMEETTYDSSDRFAEFKYINAVFGRKLNLAYDLRKQGLILSNSDLVFRSVNKVLRLSPAHTQIIDVLFKNQPHVFTQIYKNGRNIFENASQETINYLVKGYGKSGMLINIFMEAASNPEIILTESFFDQIKEETLWNMIIYAEKHSSVDFIQNCYLLPFNLDGHNDHGETFFTEAVLNSNFERIYWLIQRKDAADFILSKNSDNLNPIDLAVKLFDKGLDESYLVLRRLIPVITHAYKAGSIEKLKEVIQEFIDNCREANDNEIIINALEEEMNSLYDYAKENVAAEYESGFICFLDGIFDQIYTFKLNNMSSSSDSSDNSDNSSEYTESETEIVTSDVNVANTESESESGTEIITSNINVADTESETDID